MTKQDFAGKNGRPKQETENRFNERLRDFASEQKKNFGTFSEQNNTKNYCCITLKLDYVFRRSAKTGMP